MNKQPQIKPIQGNSIDKKKYQAKYVKFRILMLMAYKNLTFKKLRTWLTVGGVVIGIGAIVFLVSLGLGLQRLVTKEVVGSKSVKAVDVTSPKPKVLHLNGETIEKFENYSEVSDIGKTYSFAGKISYLNSTTDSVIYGANQGYLDLSSLRLVAGNSLSLTEDSDVLVNVSLLKTMGIDNPSKVVGQKIKIIVPVDKNTTTKTSTADSNQKDFTKEMKIIGVLETGSGAEVFAKDGIFEKAGYRDYNQLKIVVNNGSQVSGVRKQIESLGFSTSSPIDTLEQINQVFTILNMLLAGFGGIGMVIAVLGMFNTLTISLLERTREIGLLVSLGARKRDVRRLFVIEALVLSFLGASIGIIAAWTFGSSVNIFLMNYAKNRGVSQSISMFYIPIWLIAGILIFTCLIGFIVVAYPARRAGRISPIDALRHE